MSGDPIYIVRKPCGCVCGAIQMYHGVLPHHLIAQERARGNSVELSTWVRIDPRMFDHCPHTGAQQMALPGMDAPATKGKR